MSATAAEVMKDTPMCRLYQRVAPRPQDFPRLLDKIGEPMTKDFVFADEVRGFIVPTPIGPFAGPRRPKQGKALGNSEPRSEDDSGVENSGAPGTTR